MGKAPQQACADTDATQGLPFGSPQVPEGRSWDLCRPALRPHRVPFITSAEESRDAQTPAPSVSPPAELLPKQTPWRGTAEGSSPEQYLLGGILPWMKSSALFKEGKCATFCQQGNSCKFVLCSPSPKVTVSKDHIYTSTASKNHGCSLHRLCIFCSFFPFKAAYQNLPVAFLSSYPKNIIKNEAVNATI